MEKHYSKELKNKVINAYKSRKYDWVSASKQKI